MSTRLRIGLNATCFNGAPSGANQRFRGIYGALIRAHPEMDFVIFEPSDHAVSRWFEGAPNVTVRKTILPSKGRIRRTAASFALLRALLKRERLDLFEAFHLPLVRAPECPTILTVHDIRPVRAEVPLAKRLIYTPIVRSALRKADRIITVSEAMKREILEFEPAAVVTPIYNGITREQWTVPAEATETVRRKLDLPETFVLAVGHLERRKNYPRLIEAMAALRDGGRAVSLVIVGNDGGDGERIAAAVRRLGLHGQVRILSGLGDDVLAALYASASVIAFPSAYEGFGIPILEAMASRRPLIVSDIPVFRELTEGRGYYVPPDDGSAWAHAIADLLDHAERRRQLVRYGERRVADFAFPELAEQVARVYRSLL